MDFDPFISHATLDRAIINVGLSTTDSEDS